MRNDLITTCAGEHCERHPVCLRCVMTEEPDVQRLCYSGFSFFTPIPVEEGDDD
jgi:hypothetical protein